MKAIRMTETGGPDVLQYVDLPTPQPGPGEVLVKAHAIGVCMPEIYVRQGVYAWMPPLPLTPGIEMSGTVVEAGSGCSKLRVGQKVFVCAREFKERANCYAEYIAGPENVIYAVCDGVEQIIELRALRERELPEHVRTLAFGERLLSVEVQLERRPRVEEGVRLAQVAQHGRLVGLGRLHRADRRVLDLAPVHDHQRVVRGHRSAGLGYDARRRQAVLGARFGERLHDGVRELV